ncbi:hypothetical protein BJX61DRAFT_537761 [Aspergillus egyptiacus]|nr:hypothetical protein BJX61DRAFT_537761 [Aspergillus egyptiacus]
MHRLSPTTRYEKSVGSGILPYFEPLPPPAIRSSSSTSPFISRGADYRYHLQRGNIFVETTGLPVDIDHYLRTQVFSVCNLYSCRDRLKAVSQRFLAQSRELVKKSSGKTEWIELLHAVFEEIHPKRVTVVQGQGIPENPHPDISVGLTNESLIEALEPLINDEAEELLTSVQEKALNSDPHVGLSGLEFPFLLVEVVSAPDGGNLYQAQNRAAVSGTAAIQLRQFKSERDYIPNPASQDDVENLCHVIPRLAFSVTAEGPVHELWVHFQTLNGCFCMSCIGTWRTTVDDSAMEFLQHLYAVLQWGETEFVQAVAYDLTTYMEV